MQNENLLKNYREQISSLDQEIIYLLSRRFTIANEIWKIKKQESMDVLQQNRYKKLLENNIEKALEFWLTKELIQDLWDIIHKESLRIQK